MGDIDLGEGPSTSPFPSATLTHNFRSAPSPTPQNYHSEMAEESFVVEEPSGLPFDDSMNDDLAVESDWEYDDHYQSSLDEDYLPADYTDTEETGIADRPINTTVDMGQATEYAYPVVMEYFMNDEAPIFDDDPDPDNTESDLGSIYEGIELELNDQLVEMSGSEDMEIDAEDGDNDGGDDENPSEDEEKESENSEDQSFRSSSSEEEGSEYEASLADNFVPTLQPDNINSEASEPASGPALEPEPSTIDVFQQIHISMAPYKKLRDERFEQVGALKESLQTIEFELAQMQELARAAQQKLQSETETFTTKLASSGLSLELFSAYESFCESLYSDQGEGDGFNIACDQPHDGSHVAYDPTPQIPKDNAEVDYHVYNHKAEVPSTGEDVFFWPVRTPQLLDQGPNTWSAHFPELYGLAFEAARNGSSVASNMLVSLPDPDSAVSGWLFEFRKEELLKHHAIESRRWVFRSAHNIARPATVEAKRRRVQSIILAGGCPNCGWVFARP